MLTLEGDNGEPIYRDLPSMTTWNASVDYRFDTWNEPQTRVRFGINNLTNERAPLTDAPFDYFADVHRDLPTSFYLDVRLEFD